MGGARSGPDGRDEASAAALNRGKGSPFLTGRVAVTTTKQGGGGGTSPAAAGGITSEGHGDQDRRLTALSRVRGSGGASGVGQAGGKS